MFSVKLLDYRSENLPSVEKILFQNYYKTPKEVTPSSPSSSAALRGVEYTAFRTRISRKCLVTIYIILHATSTQRRGRWKVRESTRNRLRGGIRGGGGRGDKYDTYYAARAHQETEIKFTRAFLTPRRACAVIVSLINRTPRVCILYVYCTPLPRGVFSRRFKSSTGPHPNSHPQPPGAALSVRRHRTRV